MTRRPVQPHQLDQLTTDLPTAIRTILGRVLAVQTRASEWGRGYPTATGGDSHTTDAMAEHIANQLSPHTAQDGTVLPARPEPDPALTALTWCNDFDRLLALMWRLEAEALRLAPACTHTTNGRRCPNLATIGNWCPAHAPRCKACDQPAVYSGYCDRHRVNAPDPQADTIQRRCDCCGDLVDGPLRRGLDDKCYRAWKRDEKAADSYDQWRRNRRLWLGVELRTA